MGYQKIKAFGWIVFEIIDRLAGSETSLDLNSIEWNERMCFHSHNFSEQLC